MNLKSLRAFRLVVTHGSLAAAAEAMNLSQPAVSRLIALLEDETRLNLFDRTRRSLTLTEMGETYYRETRHILDGIDELPHIAANLRSGSNRPLRLVTGPRFGLAIVPPALTMMRQENPDLKCSVDVLPRFELENKSGIARYDLGVASLPVTHSLLPLENHPICRLRMEAVMSESHPLARKDTLTAADLADAPIIGMKPDFFGRQQVDEFFRSEGVVPDYAVETTSSLLACHMARDGAGIAIMDRLSAQAVDTTGMAVRPLEPAHWLLYGYICHKGQILTAEATAFLDCVRRAIEQFRSQSPENAACVIPQWEDA
ncbi:MAG: LysR family transcriptional regulator [Rhodospirillales bacterium]